jgi:hypothetical protein
MRRVSLGSLVLAPKSNLHFIFLSIGCRPKRGCHCETLQCLARIALQRDSQNAARSMAAFVERRGCMWKRKFRFQDCNETLLLVIRLIAALVALLSALKHFRH